MVCRIPGLSCSTVLVRWFPARFGSMDVCFAISIRWCGREQHFATSCFRGFSSPGLPPGSGFLLARFSVAGYLLARLGSPLRGVGDGYGDFRHKTNDAPLPYFYPVLWSTVEVTGFGYVHI